MRHRCIASVLMAPSFLMWLTYSFHLVPAQTRHFKLSSKPPSSSAPAGVVAAAVMPSPLTARRRYRSHIHALASNKGGADEENNINDNDKNNNNNSSDDIERGGGINISQRIGDRSVVAILAAAFLNLLGFTMAGPITPALGRHFDLTVGASFGSLTSAYPLGMLFGLALWPQLSDRIGRKPVMAISLFGSGMGLGLQSHAVRSGWSLQSFLLARVLTGCFSGSSPVSKAYLADVGVSTGRLPKYLAWRDAASTLSFIVGPVLGGLVYEARRLALERAGGEAAAAAVATDTTGSLAFVIAISSIASFAASSLVSFFVSGDLPDKKSSASKDDKQQLEDEKKIQAQKEEIVSCPLGMKLWTGVATVCVVSFLFNVGDSTFHAFFPALLQQTLGLSTKSIGLAFTCFACVSFGVSATFSSDVVRKFGPVPACAAGLTTTGLGLFFLALSSTLGGSFARVMALGAAALYYTGVPLYGPSVPTMLLRCVPAHRRGAVMGLDGAINTMARVISPLFMGEIYRRGGPSLAFSAAGFAALSGGMITVFRRLLVLRDEKKIAKADPIV
mmetsp:Transcript_19605/g.26049  ORF Transcript_19605/g.26049 Transcript_19605/m.26049 type:complete len:560 (+) Transcript_19605:135-1814(+)